MTEEEAKTRWCPMVRHFNAQFDPCGNSFAALGVDRNVHPFRCIGSACMMWRWEMRYESRDWAGKDFEKEQKKLEAAGGHIDQLNYMDPSGMVAVPSAHGFCGLAGKT